MRETPHPSSEDSGRDDGGGAVVVEGPTETQVADRLGEPRAWHSGWFPGLHNRGGWTGAGDASSNLTWSSLRKVPNTEDDALMLNVQGGEKPQESN